MSPKQIDQNQIIAEINLIPEDKCKELYELIHEFRLGLERCAPRWRSQSHNNRNEIMLFAGNWSDMPEKDFNDFCEEIEQRRSRFKSISVKSEYYH